MPSVLSSGVGVEGGSVNVVWCLHRMQKTVASVMLMPPCLYIEQTYIHHNTSYFTSHIWPHPGSFFITACLSPFYSPSRAVCCTLPCHYMFPERSPEPENKRPRQQDTHTKQARVWIEPNRRSYTQTHTSTHTCNSAHMHTHPT